MTMIRTRQIRVPRAPNVTMVPVFMAPSSSNVAQPWIQWKLLFFFFNLCLSLLDNAPKLNALSKRDVWQRSGKNLPKEAPSFKLTAVGSKTHWKLMGCQIPDSVQITMISLKLPVIKHVKKYLVSRSLKCFFLDLKLQFWLFGCLKYLHLKVSS